VSIKVGIDQGVDLKALQRMQEQGIIELRQANELEQTWDPKVTQQEGFMLDHSRLGGPDVLANDKAAEVEKILGPGNEKDVAHTRGLHGRVRVLRYREPHRLHRRRPEGRARVPARLENPSDTGTHR
jgi:hypothetical protein